MIGAVEALNNTLSAKEFFATEAPKMIAAVKEKLGSRAPKVTCDVEFDIAGEGMFTLAIKGGEATIRRGGAANPALSLKLSALSFREGLNRMVLPRYRQFLTLDIAQAETFLFAELAKNMPGKKPVTPEKALQEIQKLPMRLVLNVTPPFANGNGDYVCECAIGGAEEDDPEVVLQVAEADALLLLSGGLDPKQAFAAGRAKVTGQVATAMALISRLLV